MKFIRVLLMILATGSIVSMSGKDISKVYPIKNNGTDTIKVNKVYRVTADNCSEMHINNSIKDIVRLRIEPGMFGTLGDTSVSVSFSIRDGNNAIISKTLNINTIQKATSESYTQEALFQFGGSLDYEITITAIEVNGVSVFSFPSYISLIGEIDIDRTTEFRYNTSITPKYKLLTECEGGNSESILINWANITGAEEYQLEWTFINDYSGTFDMQNNPQYMSASNVFYDFKNNSTRITTTSSTHSITNIFEHGYLIFRVRGVGRDFNNHEIFGVWSIPVAQASVSSLPSANYSNIYHNTTVHEGGKNWQYAATYAEEGKMKEVISYFDGSLRNRQSVTKTNTDKTVLVGQTIYDSQGRPAVNVLPVPVEACNGANAIKYYNNFNRNEDNKPYNYLDFEDETNSCASYASPMNTSSGASNYYSSANTLKDRQQAYLPDAGGYPFTQIRYTPDNTGRVTLQSGVGTEFKIGSGKEIANFYGQPDQVQLDRMFGSEAGDASHYKKNMVIDANGQASVSYLNQEGKVVATSLTGAAPLGMSAVKGMTETTKLEVDMFKKDSEGISQVNKVLTDGKSIVFSTQVLVASSSSGYTYDYSLNVSDYHDECMPSTFCFSCVYDLQIVVKDECENIIPDVNPIIGTSYANKKFVGNLQTNINGEVVLNTQCTPGNQYDYQPSPITVLLNRGVYTVSKVLTLNEEALNFYVEQYLDTNKNSCMKHLSEFQGDAFAEMSLSDCDVTCEECETSLGTRDAWVAEGKGTAQEWDRLFEECGAPCRDISICEGSYIMLLNDVSPNGQYGKYEVSSEGTPILDLYSVMNETNQFGTAKNWRNPKITINGNEYTMYVDANGNPAKVELHQNGSGAWLPAPKSGVTLTADEDGRVYIKPEDLTNVSDFVSAWQPSWAKSLVKYHPEYCQYEQCIKSTKSFSPTYNITSDGFDQLLMRTTTFKQAVTDGLIHADVTPEGTPYSITEFNNPNTGRPYDPYAVTNSLYTSHSSILVAKFLYYLNNHSIEEVASYLTRYGTHYGTDTSASYNNFGVGYNPTLDTDPIRDNEWNLAKNLYLSEKRKIQEQESNLACEDGYDNAWIISHGKIPRFYGQVNIPSSMSNTEDDVASEIYNQTGLCPVAFDMMNFMGAMANARKLEENVLLDFYPEFTERLYNTIPRINNNFHNVKWEVQYVTSAEIEVFLRSEGADSDDYKKLTISKTSAVEWSEIEGIQGLSDVTYSNGSYTFTAQARVYDPNNQPDPYSYVPITGSTDIDILNCTMPAQSTPNDLSSDLRSLWIALAGNNRFESTNEVDLTANYPSYLTHNITSLIDGTDKYVWKKSQTTNEYEIYRITGSTKKIVMHINTPASVNLTDVTTFGPLSVNNQEGFEIDAFYLDHTLSNHLSGFIYVKNGDNSTTNISVGHYGMHIPGSCTGTPYQLTNDLTRLLKGQIITQSDFNDVVATKNLSASYRYTALLGTTLSPMGCKLTLSTHLNGVFNQVKITGNVIPYGFTNSDGTYSNFYMLADYFVTINFVKHIVHDTLFGGSGCLHINRCLCPLQTETNADENWFMSKITGVYNNTQDVLDAIIAGTIVQSPNISAMEIDNFTIDYFNSSNALTGATWFKYPQIRDGYILYNKTINLTTPLVEFDVQIMPLKEAYVLINGHVMSYLENPYYAQYTLPFNALQVSGMSDYLHLGENTLQILVKLYEKPLEGDIGIRGYIRTAAPCNTEIDTNINNRRPHLYIPIGNPCQDQLTATALNNAQSAYQQSLVDLTTEITEKYRSHCMGSLVENFTGSYPDKEYHFTLYYYDQAGNLIKTIPPEGVELLDLTGDNNITRNQIIYDRTHNTRSVFTEHRMETRYEYNSLNQLVKQVTPDQDKMDIWEKKLPNGLPTGFVITATQFVNANKGYLTGNIGNRGAMYETNNGGATWIKVNDLVASDLKKVQKLEGSPVIYAIGNAGVILKSTEGGGIYWDMLDTYNSSITCDLNDLQFIDANNGIVVGTNGKSFITSDGGVSFTALTGVPATANITSIAYQGSTYYISTSDNGVGAIYTKSGNNWELQIKSTQSKNLANIQYSNGKWYAVGEQGNLLNSTDGITWQVVESQTTQKITDIHYFSSSVCIALIEDQNQKKQLMKSADGGKTWSTLGTASSRYNTLYMNGANSSFAVGLQGVINQIVYSTTTHTVGVMPINEPQANFTTEVSGIHVSADGNNIWVASSSKIYYGSRSIQNQQFDFTWINVNQSSTTGYKKCYANYANNTALLLQTNGTIVKANVVGGAILITDNFDTGIADLSITTSNIVAVTYSGAVKYTSLSTFGALTSVTTNPGNMTNIISLASNGDYLSMAGNDGKLYNSTFNGTTMTWNDRSSNITPLPINDLYSHGANLYAAGDCGSMYKFVSNKWQPISTATTAKLTSVKANSTQTFFTGANGTLAVIENNTIMPIITATNNKLNDVALNDAFDKGYAIGENGTVFYLNKTNNVWNAQPTSSSGTLDLDYYGLTMVGDEAIVIGSRSSIVRQAELIGLKNLRVYTPELKSLSFANTLNGYVVGRNGTIRHTINGGATWSIVLPNVSPLKALNTVCATSVDHALIAGNTGYVASIAGNTTPQIIPISGLSQSVYTIKSRGTNLYLGGASGKLYKSTNGGSAWTVINTGSITADIHAIHIFINNSCIVAGTQGLVATYNNTSFTPTAKHNNIPAGTQLNDIYFHDDRNGYVVGNGGAIYKCKPDADVFVTGTSIDWTSKSLVDDYGINQTAVANVNINSIAFPSRYNGFIAGNISYSNTYARMLHDESEMYSTYFWYDRLGRMVVSRNTKQFNNKAYSYTLYDELGRISEVGEIGESSPTRFNSIFGATIGNLFNPNVINDSIFNIWIVANTRTQITRTFYDNPLITQTGITQDNLRKRVATATYSDTYNSDNLKYDYATHYSYDIHGNVKTLWQDNPLLDDLEAQRFKRIDYDYDLVSGKVNEVKYQYNQPDQFIHRYEYDADNRITNVYTSKDGIQFDRDAKYYYYLHGPLARVEVGNELVQGIDYAYTLQGWIKGVNSNSLSENHDIGADGKTGNPNKNVARDAFGFTLNYFDGDYTPIEGAKWDDVANRFEADKTNCDWMSSHHNLYNGNISAMATTICNPTINPTTQTYEPLPLGAVYQYDQLNRLVEMKSYSNLNYDSQNNVWKKEGNDGSKYFNKYMYDANGNILSLQRNNKDGKMFDDFTYKYQKTGGKTVSNRLYHVNDSLDASLMPDDIDDEGVFDETFATINSANNYGYDEIGNLIFDKAEGIETIEWTAYGKIKSITRRSDYFKNVNGEKIFPSNLEFRYDPTGNRIAKIEKPRDDGGNEKSQEYWLSTYYVRDATGNPMGTYKQSAPNEEASYKLIERPIYGSSRVGIDNTPLELIGYTAPTSGILTHELGLKQYELVNHLGNVLTTVSDKKIPVDIDNDGIIDYYVADITSATDYYPFGSPMDGRAFSGEKYRFGFNGKENDNEVKGAGGQQDYGFRIYDTRLGRFLSVDPLTKKYPELTPYQFASNTPIMAIDLDGLEAYLVYNKSTNILHIIPDVSQTKPELTNKFVSAFEYDKLTPEDKSKYNYGIIVHNVFTGGKSESSGEVKYETTPEQKPISNGVYSILENKGNTNPKHDSFFVLDPEDNSPYDKVDDRPGELNSNGNKRTGYNLHPGGLSHGCITINKYDPVLSEDQRAQEWSIINKAINGTKTEEVSDNRGNQKYIPFTTQTKFGKIVVIGSTPTTPDAVSGAR